MMAENGKGRRRALGGFAIFLLILIILAICCDPEIRGLPSRREPAADAALTVYFLDVGQGDAALLLSGGESMLIDGGPRDSSETLLTDLESCGVTRLDYLIATHPHEDHIGGLPAVLEQVTVEECRMPDDTADTVAFERFLTALEEQDSPLCRRRRSTTTILSFCASPAARRHFSLPGIWRTLRRGSC